MRRIIIVASVVILLAAGGYALYALLSRPETETATPTTDSGALPDIPDAPSSFPDAPIPTGPTVVVPGSRGTVTVTNFYPEAHLVTGTDVYLNSSLEYELSYSRTQGMFTIKLFPDSTATYRMYREQAEALLLSTLGIEREDACRLGVVVEVPESYIEGSSLNVPATAELSFCSSDTISEVP